MLSLLLSTSYGANVCFAGPRIFHRDEEFRKSGDRLHAALIIIVQEVGDVEIKLDIWKMAITGEYVAIRPNYGKETFMLEYGTAMWVWELNEPPRCAGKYMTENLLKHLHRRSIAGHFRLTLTTNDDLIDEEAGVTRRDATLDTFLRDQKTAAVYMDEMVLGFAEEWSVERCVEIIENLSLLDELFPDEPSITASTTDFVKRMQGRSEVC